ncbi:trigger factor [Chloroflexota bacterium]
MKVTREKTENSQAFLSVEMEPAEVEESLKKSYQRLVQKTDIPGFRKGKAPRDILEQFMGKEKLLEDALNTLIPQAYEKALKEQKIEAIARPSIELTQTDPVIFKATVPLEPKLELGDYHQLQVAREPVELTENDVSNVMEQLRLQRALWEPVERAVDFEDLVVFDIESNIGDEPLINQKEAQYQVLPDQSFPAPGFTEQMIGMKGGEDKEFALQLPPDYSKSELAGKEASFKVKVTEIKQRILPELNDEFAREVNPDCETLDSLREMVSADLKLKAEEREMVDFKERAMDAAVDLAELEFPPILVEMETDRLLREQAQRLQMEGRGLEEYLRIMNRTEEELREELQPIATKSVTRSLVLGKIAEEEKVEVSDSEIDTEIDDMIKDVKDNVDKIRESLNTPQVRRSIKQVLLTRKTVQRLVEIAEGSAVEAVVSGGENLTENAKILKEEE